MNKINLLFFAVLWITFLSTSCTKEDNVEPATGKVEFFLIDSYETVGNSPEIINNTVITKETPLISYSEIIFYDSKNYMLEISNKAKERISDLDVSLSGIAFAVKADNELIYTGYFVSMASSFHVAWTVISPYQYIPENALSINLGYPYLMNGESIPDSRNDKRILDIFRIDNKLIE